MLDIIKNLILEVNHMGQKYERVREKEEDEYFHKVIEPYVRNIDTQLNQLRNYEQSLVNTTYMNKKKVDLLFKNIEELSVECHFKRTSRKLFTEKIKAVQYDLNNILKFNV
ncbi:YppE family protein [Staphylococcus pasteuri]|uniref:YppE family protein n=1 Tax=Staphylococcus pasteuri TaxID=45972 RepID=UPI0021D101CE|nr:YppE family protein [Staphylococcus pasteuri]UXR66383.1 YppE family protein [Staphylococcus pasteuri]